MLGAGTESDADRVPRLCRRRRAVVDDRDPSIPGHQVGAVERTVKTEGLAQFGGSTAQVSVPARGTASHLAHATRPGQRSGGTEQNGDAFAISAAHGVGTPVHAVGEVHVQPTRSTEHRCVARRHALVRVTAWIDRSAVRLDLDDAGRPLTVDEDLVEQGGCDHPRVAPIEVAIEAMSCHADSAARTSSGTGAGVSVPVLTPT